MTEHAYRCYALTGGFLESSPRSSVTYWFRRLRPTIAIRPSGDEIKCIAALCMHPVGYYTGTFAGAMCPTDDVLAHLLLMRADERRFWARSNQHANWDGHAG